MAKVLYCWRCRKEMAFLEEAEWAAIHALLKGTIEKIKEYRRTTGASVVDAKSQDWGEAARRKYFELTGFEESNENAIWHHRLSLFGPPCPHCGKLLRTKTARICAECWQRV